MDIFYYGHYIRMGLLHYLYYYEYFYLLLIKCLYIYVFTT